jgi:hypothetical protein
MINIRCDPVSKQNLYEIGKSIYAGANKKGLPDDLAGPDFLANFAG